MGFFDFLFGSDPKTEVRPTTTLSPEQQAVQGQLQSFFQTPKGDPKKQQPFQGPLVAPLSNLEALSLSALEDRARALATGQPDPTAAGAQQALQQILGGGPTDFNEFFKTNVQDPLLQSFQRDITPAISRSFADQFFGGQRLETQRRANEDLLTQLVRARADLALKFGQQDTQNKLEAARLAPAVAGSDIGVLQDLLSSGAVPRTVETDQLQAEFARFKEFQDRLNQKARVLLGFLGTPTQENIVTQTGGSSGLIGGLLSGVAGGAGKVFGAKAAAALF